MQDGQTQISIQKLELPKGPFGRSVWQLVDAQDKNSAPIYAKFKPLTKPVTFEDANGDVFATMSHRFCSRSSDFSWHAAMYR